MEFWDSDLYAEVYRALRPHLWSERDRAVLLFEVYEGSPDLLDQIDPSGPVSIFLPELVRVLRRYGQVAPGRHSLVALLESIQGRVGVDRRVQVDDLIHRLGKGSVAARIDLTTVSGEFDVFLAHSSKDKAQVEVIGAQLKARGLTTWLDKEQIAAGDWFQDVIQAAIPRARSAAIFLGPGGLGRWEALELKAFLAACVERGTRVIPVLLPGVAAVPDELLFLRQLHAAKFSRLDDSAALDALVRGITGRR